MGSVHADKQQDALLDLCDCVVIDYDAKMSSLYSPAHAEDPVCFCRYVH